MSDSFDLKMPKFQNGDEMVSYVNRQIEKARAEMAAEFQEKMALTDADIEGPYGETAKSRQERLKAYYDERAEANNDFIQEAVSGFIEPDPPPAPVLLTFDIVWFDPDRSPTMFVGITGSGIDNGFLTLHADRITHLVNLSGVSHVNIWEEVHDG